MLVLNYNSLESKVWLYYSFDSISVSLARLEVRENHHSTKPVWTLISLTHILRGLGLELVDKIPMQRLSFNCILSNPRNLSIDSPVPRLKASFHYMPPNPSPTILPISFNRPPAARRPSILRGMTLERVFQVQSGQSNRHFWVLYIYVVF